MEGFAGKILRINLTEREKTCEFPSNEFYRTYMGGRAFIAYYLLKETKSNTKPLSPENKVIFANGPLTGSPLAGTGRNSVGAISPLTGGYGDAQVGGYWGNELKKAGYDAIIIEGKASEPVYLQITNGKVKICDARHLWGLKTAEAEAKIKEEMQDNKTRVCQIGLAGEKMIPYACVINDLAHFAGRTGIGAVLGSKNLRAIAVRGKKKQNYSNPEKIKDLSLWFKNNYQDLVARLSELGTSGIINNLNQLGGLPTRYFQEGDFHGAEKISGETLRDTILTKRETCYACPVRCKRVVNTGSPYHIDPLYGGPEYETIAALGSLCGIDDLEAISKGNELCNAYGLDTISTGVCIAFAMECFEKGIIGLQDSGGIDLSFGKVDAMLSTIMAIVKREGLGKILSLGVRRAAKVLGKEAEKISMHVKGQEIPMHEPRLKHALGLGYALSATGADHVHNLHDTSFILRVKSMEPMGILEPLPLTDLGPKKVRLFMYHNMWSFFKDCAVYCTMVPWSPSQVVEIMEAITGWNTSLWELIKVGERALNLTRCFNIRRGLTSKDDILPDRFFEAFSTGPLKGVQINKKDFYDALVLLYGMLGWDKNGIPSNAKLYELNLDWLIQ